MGIAILGVLLSHAMEWTESENLWVLKIGNIIGRLVFTQGFLFLSGFGLYYSLSKENNNILFYKRRMERVLIPFAIMAFPFYFLEFCMGKDSFCSFLLKESSLYFWAYGNNGMWYISVTIFLYILFPFIFNILFKSKVYKSILFRTIILIFLSETIIIFIYFINKPYYDLISIGITKIPIFLIGMIMAYMSKEDIKLNIYYFICICAIFIINLVLKKEFPFFISIYEICYRLLSIPLICVCLKYLKFQYLNIILKWLGKYSLEIYVIHILLINKMKYLLNLIEINNATYLHVLVTYLIVLLLCKPIHNWINKFIYYFKTM